MSQQESPNKKSFRPAFLDNIIHFIDNKHREIMIIIGILGVAIILFSVTVALVRLSLSSGNGKEDIKFKKSIQTKDSMYQKAEGDEFFVVDLLEYPVLDEFSLTNEWLELDPVKSSTPPDLSYLTKSIETIHEKIISDTFLFEFEKRAK